MTLESLLLAYQFGDRSGVRELQATLNAAGYPCGAPDGIAGRRTRSAIAQALLDREPWHTGTPTPEISHRARTVAPALVVLHWSGGTGDAVRLGEYWRSAEAMGKKSSHWGADESRILQYLPESVVAFHAGTRGDKKRGIIPQLAVNGLSIGVDVCQPPLVGQLPAALRRRLTVQIDGDHLTLDPAIRDNTAKCVASILRRWSLPRVFADVDEVRQAEAWVADGVTVCGHHHLNRGKPDVRAWWRDLVEAIKEAP